MWPNTWESTDKVVRKEVIDKGVFSKKPSDRSICDVVIENLCVEGLPEEYARQKLNSEILDGSTQKEIVVGSSNSRVDREIERALQMMFLSEHSKVMVVLPPTDETDNKEIKMKFEMTLKNMKLYKNIWEWSPEEKYETALKLKEEGNTLFKVLRYVDAFFKFSKACKILITLEPLNNQEMDEELVRNLNDLRAILYNNMAECHLVRGNYEHTIKLCKKVLDRDANNIKALYRRGVAYGKEKDYDMAVEDMKRVVEMEPNNKKAREQLQTLHQSLRLGNQKADEMAKRMINKFIS